MIHSGIIANNYLSPEELVALFSRIYEETVERTKIPFSCDVLNYWSKGGMRTGQVYGVYGGVAQGRSAMLAHIAKKALMDGSSVLVLEDDQSIQNWICRTPFRSTPFGELRIVNGVDPLAYTRDSMNTEREPDLLIIDNFGSKYNHPVESKRAAEELAKLAHDSGIRVLLASTPAHGISTLPVMDFAFTIEKSKNEICTGEFVVTALKARHGVVFGDTPESVKLFHPNGTLTV